MSNLEKYVNSFVEGLGVEAVIVNSELVYQSITEWDSVGHMGLIAELEMHLIFRWKRMILWILALLKKERKF